MNSEIYNDKVKITTYPAILRQSLLTLCCTSCRNCSKSVYAHTHMCACVRLHSATNDRQAKYHWCEHNSSSFISLIEVWVSGSKLSRFSGVSVTQAHSVLALCCMWPPPCGLTNSICILENREERTKKRKIEKERPRECIIFLLMYHWAELSDRAMPSCREHWEM